MTDEQRFVLWTPWMSAAPSILVGLSGITYFFGFLTLNFALLSMGFSFHYGHLDRYLIAGVVSFAHFCILGICLVVALHICDSWFKPYLNRPKLTRSLCIFVTYTLLYVSALATMTIMARLADSSFSVSVFVGPFIFLQSIPILLGFGVTNFPRQPRSYYAFALVGTFIMTSILHSYIFGTMIFPQMPNQLGGLRPIAVTLLPTQEDALEGMDLFGQGQAALVLSSSTELWVIGRRGNPTVVDREFLRGVVFETPDRFIWMEKIERVSDSLSVK